MVRFPLPSLFKNKCSMSIKCQEWLDQLMSLCNLLNCLFKWIFILTSVYPNIWEKYNLQNLSSPTRFDFNIPKPWLLNKPFKDILIEIFVKKNHFYVKTWLLFNFLHTICKSYNIMILITFTNYLMYTNFRERLTQKSCTYCLILIANMDGF